MKKKSSRFLAVVNAVVIGAGLLLLTTPGYATQNAQERRAARDVKQGTRQGAREEKRDCRAANEKSNAECRQDKRSAKQSGREASRNVRAGGGPQN